MGYHITEVKNVHVNSIDCGGMADQWNETQIQLWVPTQESDRQIDTDKALGILEKVNAIQPTNPEADCFFEAENESGAAAMYTPSGIETKLGELIIRLKNRKTQCKAIDRAETGQNCCGTKDSNLQVACCR